VLNDMVGVAREIRGERERTDRYHTALSASETMRRLTVHDLGNPLATMMLATDLLRTEELPSVQRRRVDLIGAAAERMESMIDTLSRFSELERGGLVTSSELDDPAEAVEQAVAAQALIAKSRNLQLATHLPSDALRVRLDHRLLRRIVDNLLANAIRRAPRESAIVVRLEAEGPAMLAVTVADAGVDFEPAHYARYDTPLDWTDASAAASDSGLSLAFAALASQALGGSLTLGRNAAHGCFVRVTIPIAAEQPWPAGVLRS
jgi:signal transduction histidine kinase